MTLDLWLTGSLVVLGTVGLAVVTGLRARTRLESWTLFDVALAFAMLVWMSSSVGALAVRVLTGSWVPTDLGLVPTVLCSGVGSGSACAVAMILGRPASALGFRATSLATLVVAFASAFAFVLVSAGWVNLLDALHLDVGEQQIATLFREEWGAPEMWVAVVYGMVLAPVFEEILFRGFALPPLVRVLGPAPAIALDALAFGLVHLEDPAAVPPLALLGAMLSVLRWRTGSLWPSLVLHITNNVLALALLLASGA